MLLIVALFVGTLSPIAAQATQTTQGACLCADDPSGCTDMAMAVGALCWRCCLAPSPIMPIVVPHDLGDIQPQAVRSHRLESRNYGPAPPPPRSVGTPFQISYS